MGLNYAYNVAILLSTRCLNNNKEAYVRRFYYIPSSPKNNRGIRKVPRL